MARHVLVVLVAALAVATLQGLLAQAQTCTGTSQSSCERFAGCLWYLEGSVGVCRSSPFCSSTWNQTVCQSKPNAGSCVFEGGVCKLKTVLDGTYNIGRNCRTACSDAQGTYVGNTQCSFCGQQGFCCHLEFPNGCVPDDSLYTNVTSRIRNVTFELGCAIPASASTCEDANTFNDIEECEKKAVDGCLWYGATEGCRRAPYCNDRWTETQCKSPQNAGACEWVSNACRRRLMPLPTVNTGLDCSIPCDDGSEYDPTFNKQCAFCGTQGICCNARNPLGCTPNATLCAGKKACCANPGTWGPTKSPTLPPSLMPTRSPSTSPTSSRPTGSPTARPTLSPVTSSPTQSPSSSPVTTAPTSHAPSLSPTRMPTFFGSVVEFVSTTGNFEPDVHGSQAFFDHICNIFTEYWFPTSTSCDTSKITILIAPHGASAGRRRQLDTAPVDPNIDVRFSMTTIPENISAVQIGHPESNRELRRRAVSLQFKLLAGDPPAITQTNAPASASSTDGGVTSAMYIGIGVGCFALFLLLALIIVVRRRRQHKEELPYPRSESYRRKDIYIPPKDDQVLIVRADEFRTVPPMTKRDYVAEEAGGVFSVGSREVPIDHKTQSQGHSPAGGDDSTFVYSGGAHAQHQSTPQKTKSFHRTMSQRSDRSDDRRPLSRKDSRRSAGSARSGNDSDSPQEYRTREDTLYRHQMSPYFSGRNSLEGDELEATMPSPPPARTPTARPPPPSGRSQSARGNREGELVAYTSNRNGMSDWI